MEKSTFTYNPLSKSDVAKYRTEGISVPFTVTITSTGPSIGAVGATQAAATTPVDTLASTVNRLLCMFGDELAGWLVIHAHLSNYNALAEAESAASFEGCKVAADYYNYCIKPAVARMCPKPCSEH